MGGFCSCQLPYAVQIARDWDRWCGERHRQWLIEIRQRSRMADEQELFSTCDCIGGCANCADRNPAHHQSVTIHHQQSGAVCVTIHASVWTVGVCVICDTSAPDQTRCQNSCKCFLLCQKASYFVEHCFSTLVPWWSPGHRDHIAYCTTSTNDRPSQKKISARAHLG